MITPTEEEIGTPLTHDLCDESQPAEVAEKYVAAMLTLSGLAAFIVCLGVIL